MARVWFLNHIMHSFLPQPSTCWWCHDSFSTHSAKLLYVIITVVCLSNPSSPFIAAIGIFSPLDAPGVTLRSGQKPVPAVTSTQSTLPPHHLLSQCTSSAAPTTITTTTASVALPSSSNGPSQPTTTTAGVAAGKVHC